MKLNQKIILRKFWQYIQIKASPYVLQLLWKQMILVTCNTVLSSYAGSTAECTSDREPSTLTWRFNYFKTKYLYKQPNQQTGLQRAFPAFPMDNGRQSILMLLLRTALWGYVLPKATTKSSDNGKKKIPQKDSILCYIRLCQSSLHFFRIYESITFHMLWSLNI